MKNLTRKSLVAVGLMMSLSTLANDSEMTIKEKEKNCDQHALRKCCARIQSNH